MLLAGCNQLPAEPVDGDDQGLRTGDSDDAGALAGSGAKDVPNGTAEASANDPGPGIPGDCELKAKECYANGYDAKLCESILQSCLPPAPATAPCAQDCDTLVRNCFAKGIDAKTCDAEYHACLSPQPGGEPAPGYDPVTECMIEAKGCYAKGEDPAVCDALLSKCTPQAPAPTVDFSQCDSLYKECQEAGDDTATCDVQLKECYVKLANAGDPNAPGAGAGVPAGSADAKPGVPVPGDSANAPF
jgi:hypothetical protein